MLPELIPILELGLDSDDAAERQGVCIGLTEIIQSWLKVYDHLQKIYDL